MEINSLEENQLIQERGKPADLAKDDWQHIWLGMRRGDDNLYQYVSSGKHLSFFNWQPSQVDDHVPGSKCALMVISTDNIHGTWFPQEQCNQKELSKGNPFDVKNVVCEVGEAPYRFLDEPLLWEQAQFKCKRMGWQLVEINSKEENDFVLMEVEKRGESLTHWIGLRNKNERSKESAKWAWDSGVQLTFSNWRTGQPDNSGGKENCADMRDGLWNDAACVTKHPAICEKQESLFLQSKATHY